MIIWTGRGIIILMVMGASFALIDYMGVYRNAEAYSMIAAGIFSWIAGSFWNRPKEIYYETNGKTEIIVPNHSLFWIKMQYWGPILIVLAIIIIIAS